MSLDRSLKVYETPVIGVQTFEIRVIYRSQQDLRWRYGIEVNCSRCYRPALTFTSL